MIHLVGTGSYSILWIDAGQSQSTSIDLLGTVEEQQSGLAARLRLSFDWISLVRSVYCSPVRVREGEINRIINRTKAC